VDPFVHVPASDVGPDVADLQLPCDSPFLDIVEMFFNGPPRSYFFQHLTCFDLCVRAEVTKGGKLLNECGLISGIPLEAADSRINSAQRQAVSMLEVYNIEVGTPVCLDENFIFHSLRLHSLSVM
jgi:hypothetical protein